MRLSLESALKKSRPFPHPWPRRMEREGKFHRVLPRSKEHGRGGTRVLRELGRSSHLHGQSAAIRVAARNKAPRPRDGAPAIAWEQTLAQPWYRQAKENEARREG
jgi:hypothetical protein